ncbi:MAG: T9SS type A sorting domain-containing protein [Bacteroidetes bacterium]|nr:T9SS type A sorting domain-containing protein [Bacteroidota bacterium]
MKKLYATILTAMLASAAFAQCSDLFFSEYLEGSSNNKAIEVYNPTSNAVNLGNYRIYRYNNGSPTPTDSLQMLGTLAPGAVYVAGNSQAVAAILGVSDTLHTITFFNGDDAMVLKNVATNAVLDIIGIVGVDPGTNWPVGTGATSEFTLVRNFGTQQGNTNWALAANEYDAYPQNTFTYLGSHAMTPCCLTPSGTISAVTNVDCNGNATGSATVSATGGNSFTYSWSPIGGTAATASGLAAGSYTVTITNDCNATTTASVTITQPPTLQTTAVATNNVSCNGGNDGSAVATAFGGTTPFTYQWTPSGGNATTASGLTAGIYTFTVTDDNGCVQTDTVVINQPAPLNVTLSLSIPDTVCNTTSLFTLGGESPTGGVWSGSGVSGNQFDPTQQLGNVIITYTYTDTNNCSASAVDSVWVENCTGMNEAAELGCSIYPNPAQDVITITWNGASPALVTISDISGRVLLTEQLSRSGAQIHVNALPAGTYVVRATINQQDIVMKLVK